MIHSPTLKIATVMPPMATIPARWSMSAMAGVHMKIQRAQAAMNAAKAPTYRRNVMNGDYIA